jgi:uncharacterized protein (DUF2461 family)
VRTTEGLHSQSHCKTPTAAIFPQLPLPLNHVTRRRVIHRIHRDLRFSHDQMPYKPPAKMASSQAVRGGMVLIVACTDVRRSYVRRLCAAAGCLLTPSGVA